MQKDSESDDVPALSWKWLDLACGTGTLAIAIKQGQQHASYSASSSKAENCTLRSGALRQTR